MNMLDQTEQPNNKWTEGDVDRLLTGFFKAEMPEDLRVAATVQPARSKRQSNLAVWAGLAVTAAALMVAVIVTRPGADRDSNTNVAIDMQQQSPSGALERVETDEGTLEMRLRLVEADTASNVDEQDLQEIGVELEWSFEGEMEADEEPTDEDSTEI